jgi:hypothetical protein
MTYVEDLTRFIENRRALHRSHFVLFVFGETAPPPSGPGPPHSRGF